MKIISTIGKMHCDIPGYNYKIFSGYVKSFGINDIFITYLSEEKYNKNKEKYKEIEYINDLNIIFNDIDYNYYDKLRNNFEMKPVNAENITKRNILDIINTVIDSYLKGYWKDPETVNSDVTDSIFKAKHKFLLSLNPDYEEKYWLPLHEKIYNNILNIKNNIIIISDIESSFFYKDKIK